MFKKKNKFIQFCSYFVLDLGFKEGCHPISIIDKQGQWRKSRSPLRRVEPMSHNSVVSVRSLLRRSELHHGISRFLGGLIPCVDVHSRSFHGNSWAALQLGAFCIRILEGTLELISALPSQFPKAIFQHQRSLSPWAALLDHKDFHWLSEAQGKTCSLSCYQQLDYRVLAKLVAFCRCSPEADYSSEQAHCPSVPR